LREIERDTSARTDITILNFECGKSCDVDVSITDARTLLSTTNLAKDDILIPMQAARNKEYTTNNTYKDIITASGNLFAPLVMESHGHGDQQCADSSGKEDSP
jgi:hypothetical protein